MRTMREFLNVKSEMSADALCNGMISRTKSAFLFYFLIPSLFVLVASYILDTRANAENIEYFFQRAGALVVILFVAIEFRLYRHIARYERVISTSEYIVYEKQRLSSDNISDYCEKYLTGSFFVRCSLAAGGIIGTLIWGYGDLLFKMIG